MSLLFCENDSLHSSLLSFELLKWHRQKFVLSQTSALIGQLWHQPADDSKLTSEKYFFVAKKGAEGARFKSSLCQSDSAFCLCLVFNFIFCVYLLVFVSKRHIWTLTEVPSLPSYEQRPRWSLKSRTASKWNNIVCTRARVQKVTSFPIFKGNIARLSDEDTVHHIF